MVKQYILLVYAICFIVTIIIFFIRYIKVKIQIRPERYVGSLYGICGRCGKRLKHTATVCTSCGAHLWQSYDLWEPSIKLKKKEEESERAVKEYDSKLDEASKYLMYSLSFAVLGILALIFIMYYPWIE